MADRYFWHTIRMDKVRVRKYLDFDLLSEGPGVEQGRTYVDADGKLRICKDGLEFTLVGAQSSSHSSSSSASSSHSSSSHSSSSVSSSHSSSSRSSSHSSSSVSSSHSSSSVSSSHSSSSKSSSHSSSSQSSSHSSSSHTLSPIYKDFDIEIPILLDKDYELIFGLNADIYVDTILRNKISADIYKEIELKTGLTVSTDITLSNGLNGIISSIIQLKNNITGTTNADTTIKYKILSYDPVSIDFELRNAVLGKPMYYRITFID